MLVDKPSNLIDINSNENDMHSNGFAIDANTIDTDSGEIDSQFCSFILSKCLFDLNLSHSSAHENIKIICDFVDYF